MIFEQVVIIISDKCSLVVAIDYDMLYFFIFFKRNFSRYIQRDLLRHNYKKYTTLQFIAVDSSHTADIVSLIRSGHPGRLSMPSGHHVWTRGNGQGSHCSRDPYTA